MRRRPPGSARREKYDKKGSACFVRTILKAIVYTSMAAAVLSMTGSLFYLETDVFVQPPPTTWNNAPESPRYTHSISSSSPHDSHSSSVSAVSSSTATSSSSSSSSSSSASASSSLTTSLQKPPLHPTESEIARNSGSASGATIHPQPSKMANPALVIVAHARENYLRRSLSAVLKADHSELFKIYVSLDSPPNYGKMENLVRQVAAEEGGGGGVDVNVLKMRPRSNSAFESSGIGRISRHHEFALKQGFEVLGHSHVIILEEDLVVAKDFFTLFVEASDLLAEDPSLFCVSAWNDNGLEGWDRKRLFRTDYFAGLGWMIRQQEWERLAPKWPDVPSTGWDHWMRLPTSNQMRECIVPEVSRTRHIGDKGVNVKSGQNNIYSRWAFADEVGTVTSFGDLSYLQEDKYEAHVKDLVKKAYAQNRMNIYTLETFQKYASRYKLWRNQPRGTHRGLIIVHNQDDSYDVFADARKAWDYISPVEQMHPKPGIAIIPGNRGLSCSQVCSNSGKRCEQSQLQFANTCEELMKAFACEAGCGHQMGYEIPSYVVESSERTYRQCLVADEVVSTCGASHPITRRLCACI